MALGIFFFCHWTSCPPTPPKSLQTSVVCSLLLPSGVHGMAARSCLMLVRSVEQHPVGCPISTPSPGPAPLSVPLTSLVVLQPHGSGHRCHQPAWATSGPPQARARAAAGLLSALTLPSHPAGLCQIAKPYVPPNSPSHGIRFRQPWTLAPLVSTLTIHSPGSCEDMVGNSSRSLGG